MRTELDACAQPIVVMVLPEFCGKRGSLELPIDDNPRVTMIACGPSNNVSSLNQANDWRWFWLYVAITLLIQWRLVGSVTTHISYGREEDATVPMLNLWTVWWNADRAQHGFQHYWDAPLFYPTEKTFPFSETQPTSLIVAPLVWATGNRVLAYNVYQLLILTLNGLSAHQLFRRLGHRPWLAFCGGMMSQILPFVIWQFGVVQLTTLCGIHWTLLAMLDLFGYEPAPANAPADADEEASQAETNSSSSAASPSRLSGPCWRNRLVGVRLGLAYGLTYWLCNYWGLFLTLLLVPCSICFWNQRLLTKSFWCHVAVAALLSGLMIGPFAWMQHTLASEHRWKTARTEELVFSLSAHWRDYTNLPWASLMSWLEFPEVDRAQVWTLGAGWFKTMMAPLGFLVACANPQRRRWGLFALLFGAMAFGLSLGPTVRLSASLPLIGEAVPYSLLQQYVPGFSLIRSPFRFAIFVQLAIVWLSLEAIELFNPTRWGRRPPLKLASQPAKGLELMGVNSDCGFGSNWWRWSPCAFPFVVVSLLITFEAIPPASRLYAVTAAKPLPAWVMWLRDHDELEGALACLPFPAGSVTRDYEETTTWMYWGTFHGRPLVNGYSGFFPKPYLDLRNGFASFQRKGKQGANDPQPRFPDYSNENSGLKRLNESGARFVMMKRSFGTREEVQAHPLTQLRWKQVYSDEVQQVDLYEIILPTE